jgi:hypothetical protein
MLMELQVKANEACVYVSLRNVREQYDYVKKHIKHRLTTGFMSLLNTAASIGFEYWAVS